MQHPMSLPVPPQLATLTGEGPVALFLDFDGTLVDIAPTHDSIHVPSGMSGALEKLSASLDKRLALVSGRSLDNLALHLGSIAVAQAGSHGADSRLADGRRVGAEPRTMPKGVVDALQRVADAYEGASLETKSHGAALHFRAKPELEPEILKAADALAVEYDLATKRGKCVVELLADRANKGIAVSALMREPPFAQALPVFIGDDVTDEDGFAAVIELGGFGILVGASRETKACYRLAAPQDVHHWLGLENL